MEPDDGGRIRRTESVICRRLPSLLQAEYSGYPLRSGRTGICDHCTIGIDIVAANGKLTALASWRKDELDGHKLRRAWTDGCP